MKAKKIPQTYVRETVMSAPRKFPCYLEQLSCAVEIQGTGKRAMWQPHVFVVVGARSL